MGKLHFSPGSENDGGVGRLNPNIQRLDAHPRTRLQWQYKESV